MKRLSAIRSLTPRQRRERGVYAIEFAFVFLIFFSLIYGIICYAVIFTFRSGLQNAAEDGARAALRHETAFNSRCVTAKNVALARSTGWLPVTPAINAEIRGAGTATCPGTLALKQCKDSPADCQIVVTITARGMTQVFPIFTFVMPDVLIGQASVLLDTRGL